MTFSIVGRCPETGQLGIAISSSSIASSIDCLRFLSAPSRRQINLHTISAVAPACTRTPRL